MWILTLLGAWTGYTCLAGRCRENSDVLEQLLYVWLSAIAPAEPAETAPEASPAVRLEGPAPPPAEAPKPAPAPEAPTIGGLPPVRRPAPGNMSKTTATISGERQQVTGRARVRDIKLDATRIDDDAIEIDGRPVEREWMKVPALPEMVQIDPRYGYRPTHATDVRVAYGKKGLYIGFTCYDDPAHVRAGVFRKDQIGPSDLFYIDIDPNNNDTSGFEFVLNPSGSQEDYQIFRDDNEEPLWDGVWKSAAKVTDKGWSGEIFIPWSTIRFELRDEYTFGINVGRWLNHDGEWHLLSPAPQGFPGRLSWALDYRGIKGIEPGLNLEVRPFVSLRGIPRRPEDSLDRSFPVLPNGGFDLKYGLKGNLTLDLAVNPDFGQAEVDPAVLNLGPFEVYFPERRTFFLESKEIFETRFQLFYSRRIGRIPRAGLADQTPRDDGKESDRASGELVAIDPLTRIFGALRVTGQVAKGWTLGVLTANTGATFGVERFTDGIERKVTVDPISQYSVIRLRREFDGQSSVGMILTNVVRGGGEPAAVSGGFDYRLRFRERWRHSGQIIGTYNGQRTGMGAISDLSRGGKNVSFGGTFETLTPHADFNDLGFMRFNNYLDGKANVSLYNAQPVGRIRKMAATLSSQVASSYTGLLTQKQLHLDMSLTTLGLWGMSLWTGGHLPQYDLFETRGGIPYVVPFHWWLGGSAYTPDNKRAVAVFNWAYGEQNGRPGPDYGLELRLRPVNRLEMTLRGDVNLSFGRPRWTTTNALGEPVFGRAYVVQYIGVLRGTLGILPNLTLQSFNQLYFLSARHTDFFILTAPDTLVPTDPAPYLGDVDQGLTSFISNSILRWEYRPGSFLFFVYTHRTVLTDFSPKFSYRPAGGFGNLITPGVANEDILFVKLQHMFGL